MMARALLLNKMQPFIPRVVIAAIRSLSGYAICCFLICCHRCFPPKLPILQVCELLVYAEAASAYNLHTAFLEIYPVFWVWKHRDLQTSLSDMVTDPAYRCTYMKAQNTPQSISFCHGIVGCRFLQILIL